MRMKNTFDSYPHKDKVCIVTKQYSEIRGEDVICENIISIERAAEIIKSLQNTIELVQEAQNTSFDDETDGEVEPCPTCGDIDGMVNPCCAGYDQLHYKNCGYG